MMGLNKPITTTPLFVDMEIATQLLHRSHGEFLGLSRAEKKKLRLYYRVRYQKEEELNKNLKMKVDVRDDIG